MKTRLIATAATALLALTGCAGGTVADPAPGVRAVTVPLDDGSTVQCVTRSSGGIDCDWNNTTPAKETR